MQHGTPIVNAMAESSTFAWEPLTPRGVAAFARAPLLRLLLVELMVAVLAAAAVIWFLHEVWFPTVREAIRQLPAQGEIRQGKLAWRGDSPVHLAGDRFLAIVVDLNHEAEVGREADVSVEFGQKEWRFFSLLGYTAVNYPSGWVVALNQAKLEPWWGAWEPAILACAGTLVALGLMMCWALLATVYSPLALLVAFFTNRELTWRSSWRLASAALMPGALALTAAIFLYGVSVLDFVRLGICAVLHFVMGWIYLFVSPLFLPRHPSAQALKGNPFAAPPADNKQ
jgi:hypothetical protein